MGAFTKRWIIRKRRTRKEKIDLLRKRYSAARADNERNAILQKAVKVAPHMSTEQFLGPIQQVANKS